MDRARLVQGSGFGAVESVSVSRPLVLSLGLASLHSPLFYKKVIVTSHDSGDSWTQPLGSFGASCVFGVLGGLASAAGNH